MKEWDFNLSAGHANFSGSVLAASPSEALNAAIKHVACYGIAPER